MGTAIGIIDENIIKMCKNEGISVEELRSGSCPSVCAGIAIGLVKEHGVALANENVSFLC